MSFRFLDDWTAPLPRDAGHVVAVVGAGGKSAWIEAAAAVLGRDRPVTVVDSAAAADAAPDTDLVLAEIGADGGRPLAPTPLPALPRRATLAVVVQGLDVIGRPLAAFGEAGDAGDAGAVGGETVWDWDRLFAHLSRALDGRPEGVPVLAAFLQLDACDDAVGLFAFLERVMEELVVPIVTVGDTSGPEPRLRTAYRVEGPSTNPSGSERDM